jgi:hypothetical protein
MLRFAKPDDVRGIVPGAVVASTDEDIYDRHAGNLYWQALFTLDDCAMAEQVVGDVLVEECVRPGAAILRPGLEGPAGGRCLPAVHGPNWQPAGTVAPSPGVPHRRLCGSGRADRQGARRPRAGAFRRPGAPAGWPRSGHLRVRHSCTAASRTRQRRGRDEPEFATVTKDSSDATRPSCGNSPRCCQRRSKVDPLAPEN